MYKFRLLLLVLTQFCIILSRSKYMQDVPKVNITLWRTDRSTHTGPEYRKIVKFVKKKWF